MEKDEPAASPGGLSGGCRLPGSCLRHTQTHTRTHRRCRVLHAPEAEGRASGPALHQARAGPKYGLVVSTPRQWTGSTSLSWCRCAPAGSHRHKRHRAERSPRSQQKPQPGNHGAVSAIKATGPFLNPRPALIPRVENCLAKYFLSYSRTETEQYFKA